MAIFNRMSAAAKPLGGELIALTHKMLIAPEAKP
jgi:hypothetical protein